MNNVKGKTGKSSAPSEERSLDSLAQYAKTNAALWEGVLRKIDNCLVKRKDQKEVVDPFLLRRTIKEFRANDVIATAVGPIIDEIDEENINACNASINEFGVLFEGVCKNLKLTIMGESPRFVVNDSINVEIDTKLGICSLWSKQVKSLSMDTIADELQSLLALIDKYPFNGVEYVEDLFKAYRRCCANRVAGIGYPVPAKEVYGEMVISKQSGQFKKNPSKINFNDYPLEVFQVDLSKMQKAKQITQAGYRLSFIPTTFAKEGLAYLDDSLGVRYCGSITFVSNEANND